MKKTRKSLRVLVAGYSGRMGQELAQVILSDPDLTLVGGVDQSQETGAIRVEVEIGAFKKKDVDVVIDFSSPALFRNVLEWCGRNKVALVSGTTGLKKDDFARMKSVSRRTPILWAPNMSLGVAMFVELIKSIGRIEGFDFQIEEFHHRHKKDKPSGTALHLQRALEENSGRKQPVPLSIRGGGIFGVHRLYAMSPDETLTIEHTALNRSVFARGAVGAARWLAAKGPGLFSLEDTLKP